MFCGMVKTGSKNHQFSVVVAGGRTTSGLLSSVEILDDLAGEWRAGPFLPHVLAQGASVEDSSGGLTVVGGLLASGLETIYRLPHSGQDAKWIRCRIYECHIGPNLH
jgi:hypothetical protein